MDDKVVDLNLAYAFLLHEEGESKAYEVATARIPPCMISFLEGGEPSIDAARRTIKFVAKKGVIAGPRGEKIVFGS